MKVIAKIFLFFFKFTDRMLMFIYLPLFKKRGRNIKFFPSNSSFSYNTIELGDDVFIGVNSIVTKGVTIGDRSIIAAGSIVVKSIPNDEIWGGNPAKFLKKIK